LKKRLEKRLTLTWQFGHQQERDIKKPKGRDFSHHKEVSSSEGIDQEWTEWQFAHQNERDMNKPSTLTGSLLARSKQQRQEAAGAAAVSLRLLHLCTN
jgi:hypothetical protein